MKCRNGDVGRILTVCSTIDYTNFTRRATIEAIRKLHPALDVMLFNGVTSMLTAKVTYGDARFFTHHRWLPERASPARSLQRVEAFVRRPSRTAFFNRYGIVFLTDPNQYHLLPFIGRQKVVYLIRDPNVLQSPALRNPERAILDRADVVLATSINLAERYLPKYHGMQHPDIHYWPNCVDLELWNIERLPRVVPDVPTIGVAGNFGPKRTDYELLEYLAANNPGWRIEIAGRIDTDTNAPFWRRLLANDGVTYRGVIPHDELPAAIAHWSVGLITDRISEYTSYMHHNKVYQYLALGKPVVSIRTHNDYEPLAPEVNSAENAEEYGKAVRKAIEAGTSTAYANHCGEIAKENSAENRATMFMELLQGVRT